MSPRRRGRGRGNGAGGPVAVAGAAAVPSASAADVGSPDQDADTVVGRPSPTVVPGNATPHSGTGFSPNGGRSRSSSFPRGADSRRPPRASTPILVPSTPAPDASETSSQQDAGDTNAPIVQRTSSCTLAQMRRFIKSRPYVPVHELRRRFLIDGIEDEVSPMPTNSSPLYVGLPPREAGFLGALVKAGGAGCEPLLDPTGPAIIGVFPMRPVVRQ